MMSRKEIKSKVCTQNKKEHIDSFNYAESGKLAYKKRYHKQHEKANQSLREKL